MRASVDSRASKPPDGALRQPATTAPRSLPACPHLGSIDDPATAFGYASPGNKCYCRPSPSKRWPAAIDLHYQERFCLTDRYTACPVYQEAENEARAAQAPAPAGRWRLPALAGIVQLVRARFLTAFWQPWGRRLLVTALLIMFIVALRYVVDSGLPAGDISPQNDDDDGAAVAVTMAHATSDRPMVISVNTATPAPPTPSATVRVQAAAPELAATATASPVASPSPSPTPTATASPTVEPSATPTASATANVVTCAPPAGWITYVVQPGDNLFRIGLRHNATVSTMMRANCLGSTDIYAGQRLFVPFQAPMSTASPVPAATETVAPTESAADPPADTPVPPTNTAQPAPTTEPPTATALPTATPPSPTSPPLPTATAPSPTESPLPTATPVDTVTPTVEVTLSTPVATGDANAERSADDL